MGSISLRFLFGLGETHGGRLWVLKRDTDCPNELMPTIVKAPRNDCKKDRQHVRGLSMLETMLAILLMTMTLWSLQTLYVNLLSGTRTSDARREAVAEAESLLAIWKLKTRDLWPEGQGSVPTTEAFSVEGSQRDFLYRVDISGRLPNPLRGEASESEKPEVLEMQTVTVTLYYQEEGEATQERLYVRLVGGVSN